MNDNYEKFILLSENEKDELKIKIANFIQNNKM